MNRALWSKGFRESRVMLASLGLLLFGFNWLFIALLGTIKVAPLTSFLKTLPFLENLIGMPISMLATPLGGATMAYAHPVVLLSSLVWCISRGSDVVAGELDRGTMEMLLAQPVRRSSLILVQSTITVAGCGLLASCCWLGGFVGLSQARFRNTIDPLQLLPAAVNLFACMVAISALATLASSWDRYRWRMIGLVVGFYIVELIVKLVARMAAGYEWLGYFSFLSAYEPQKLLMAQDEVWRVALTNVGVLMGLALLAFTLATVIFNRRDLPAPL